jgi:hypothetical protein
MKKRIREFLNRNRKFATLMLIFVVVLFFILLGYLWNLSGFGPYISPTKEFQREKTLWDWLQLIGVPLTIAGIVWWLNRSEQNRQNTSALDRIHEDRLQAYFDKMTDLLEKGLKPVSLEPAAPNSYTLRNLASVVLS